MDKSQRFFLSMKTITVQSISKKYHDKKVLDEINFKVNAGSITGLLGPNGAGKTTTMSIMTGIVAPDGGQVLFDDIALSAETEMKIKEKIGYLSEANPLYEDMFVSEYLDYMAGLRGIPKAQRKQAIREVAKETGIEDKLMQPIEELSKGYRQRVGLAQAIIHKPEILILDEPTEGLDPNQRVTIRDLIQRLGKDRTVLISTHVLSEVQAMCDHVIILNQGKLVSQGSVQEILQQSQGGQKVMVEARGTNIAETLRGKQYKIIEEKQVQDRLQISLLAPANTKDIRPEIFALAKDHNWVLYELHQQATNLEDIFRTLTLGK